MGRNWHKDDYVKYWIGARRSGPADGVGYISHTGLIGAAEPCAWVFGHAGALRFSQLRSAPLGSELPKPVAFEVWLPGREKPERKAKTMAEARSYLRKLERLAKCSGWIEDLASGRRYDLSGSIEAKQALTF